MPKKSKNPLKVETNEYRVFDPKNVKQTVEIPVKPEPTIEDIEKVEVVNDNDKKGNSKLVAPVAKKKKKTTKKKKKATKKKKTKSFTKSITPIKFKEKKLKKEGYVLVITEKPQAAEKIAAALGEGKDKKISNTNKVSYYELTRNNKRVVVVNAVGHLFSVSQSIKGTDYPIFDIGWFPNYEVKKNDFTKKYYSVIEKLAKGASEIVVATDFDVEGEVIGYNVVRFIANQKDAKRMKFSALTAPEVQKAYDNANPTIEWGQAIAGETRHFLDWLYGINLSRALMHAMKTTGKFKIMSIGRVQGPALNLIVNKEKEIKKFISTPYWQIFAKINDGKNTLELKHNKDITKKEELDKFEKLKGRETVAKTKKTKQTLTPPAPFDLTTLQTESYKFHGITPTHSLQAAQKLYLAGLISYPRTSSQKIPEAMEPLKILEKLKKRFPKLANNATKKKPIEGKKTDPAHPAIIPTGTYKELEGYDEKIYNLVLKRFISCFCDDAELENKRVETTIDNLRFATKGMEILQKGWMEVYPIKMEEKEVKDFDGSVTIDEIKIEEKQTKPPNRFSPASILRELEKRNLGTKATRANILETLYNRSYIKEKSIQATELGIRLIDSLEKHSPIIIDEKLTREIEKDMDIIRNSKKDLNKKQLATIKIAEKALKEISKQFKSQEIDIGKDLIAANEALYAQEKEENRLKIPCPSCKKGELGIKYTPRFKSYFIACDQYPDCKQTFPLPSQSTIKKTDKICEECSWPMLLRLKPGKRPWVLCPNPNCPSKLEMDADGNLVKKKPRYSGKKTKTKPEKKIAKVV
jgi:DNA topoisomerase-1